MENQTYMEALRRGEKRALIFAYSRIGLALIVFIAISYGVSAPVNMILGFFPEASGDAFIRSMISMIISIFALTVPSFILIKWLTGEEHTMPGFFMPKKNNFHLLLLGIGAIALGNFAAERFSGLMSAFGINIALPDMEVPDEPFLLMLYIIRVAFVAGVFEELLFRGAILAHLRKFGDITAVVVSAFIFAVAHGNPVQSVFTFILGLALGYMAVRTNSLAYPMIIHILNNLFSIVSNIVLNSTDIDEYGYLLVIVLSAALVIFSVVAGAVGVFSEADKLKKQKELKISNGDGVLSLGQKLGALFMSPSFDAAFVFFTVLAISKISF